MKEEKLQKKVKHSLSHARYQHTLGVMDTAESLAARYGCDAKKARLAALLHDSAKLMKDKKKIDLCEKYGVAVNETERQNPSLLHAKCGALLAKYRYEVNDFDILHAIAVHTTGVPDMNLLDQIIFVADYIEPGREKAPHLPELRKLAERDLEETVYRILDDSVAHLRERSDRAIDPMTLQAYLFYKQKMEQRNTEA